MTTLDSIEHIETRQDFGTFLSSLRADLADHPNDWENGDLESFLEALSAWVEGMDSFYANIGSDVPERPTWRTFAEMLAAARVYE